MSWTAMKNMESVSKGMAAGENHGGTNLLLLTQYCAFTAQYVRK